MTINNYNIFLMILVILIAWIPWLWRYKFKPMSAKRALKKLLKKHPEAEGLIRKENILKELFKGIYPKKISQQERKRLKIEDDAFVYGEIEFLPFYTLLDRVTPRTGEIFYDLGSGAGKAVFSAAIYFDFKNVYGIELLPGLFQIAKSQIEKAKQMKAVFANKINRIHFINDNFLNIDFSDGDVIFINATCLSYTVWQTILLKLIHLKQGSRVIVTTKKIELKEFKTIYQGFNLMSWGMNSVNIYLKTT